MAVEIERKFLVANDKWRRRVKCVKAIRQGYLPTKGGATVRIRIATDTDGDCATLTIKGPTKDIVRAEFEHEIQVDEALEMLDLLCGVRIVEKLRHIVPSSKEGFIWEIDEFTGRHQGLVIAEIELDRPNRKVRLPKWLGREVSRDARYSSRSLAERGLREVKKDMVL